VSVVKRCLIIVVALGMAACSSPVVSTTTTSPPEPTTTGSSTTTTEPSAQVVIYLLMNDVGNEARPGPFLVPVERTAQVGDLESTLTVLLAGPNTDETQMVPAIGTAIPDDTVLQGVEVADGVATVDLSEAFESGGGSFAMFARLAQIVYTATRFDGVDSVEFELAGAPVTVFSSEGIVLDGPQTRDDYIDLLPLVFVDSPAYGGELGNPAHLSGVAAVFEATFQAAIVDSEGLIIAQPDYLMTSEGMGWGTFDATIDYDVDEAQWGSLIVWEDSAEDGSEVNIREYRVWLVPAP